MKNAVIEQPVIDRKAQTALDAAAKKIVDETPSLPPPKRAHGRPKGGKAVFKQVRIDLIPEVGGPSEVARALGIARASLYQWCQRKKNPLPFATAEGGQMLFSRDVVIKWLSATRRYKLQREYVQK